MRALAVLLLVALSGCAGLRTPSVNHTSASVLLPVSSDAARDSVAAFLSGLDGLAVAEAPTGWTLRDARPGEENVATVTLASIDETTTRVHVWTTYRARNHATFQDVAWRVVSGLSQAQGAGVEPLPGYPSCPEPEIRPRHWTQLDPEQGDVEPELIGGLESVARAMHYPNGARRANIEGFTVVQFVVDEQGTVVCPVPVLSPSPSLTNEALRVVGLMRFEPGSAGGRPVRVLFTLPLRFSLR